MKKQNFDLGFIVTRTHATVSHDLTYDKPDLTFWVSKGRLFLEDFLIRENEVIIDYGTGIQTFDLDRVVVINSNKIVSVYRIIKYSMSMGFCKIKKNLKLYFKAMKEIEN